jgi:(2R)-sulfolactate sulfo-lyase subunit alpha
VTTHILIHKHRDSVGVAAVEGIEAGMKLTGWVMDTDDTVTVEARKATGRDPRRTAARHR